MQIKKFCHISGTMPVPCPGMRATKGDAFMFKDWKRWALTLLGTLLVVACGTSGVTGLQLDAKVLTTVRQAASETLVVGLYPSVPRPEQLQKAIVAAWSALHPDVTLRFNSDWDGGYKADPSGMDVFVFDAIFLDHFRDQNLLAGLDPGSVSNLDDYVPYAIVGAEHGGKYYGLPMFGCANILFYRTGDGPVVNATTLTALTKAVGQCTYTSQIPPDKRGLLMDLAGGTTNACMYIDLAESIDGQWPVPLPTDPSELNPTAIAGGRSLLSTASYYNATTDPSEGPYSRAAWFSEGNGRILMGFTEAMSAMTADTRANLQFKPFPLGDDVTASSLFYSDLIGISQGTLSPALAVELANLMASTDVLVAGMQGTGSEPPQFLMPVRTSVFQALEREDALYTRMHAMVMAANPILFNLGVEAREYISGMKEAIKQQTRADYPCGCDQNGGMITTQSQADAACPGVCGSFGGWNGQWTPYPPGGTSEWQSGCGCNTCPAP